MIAAAMVYQQGSKSSEVRLQESRKVSSFLNQKLGVSFKDLPEALRIKVEQFGAKPFHG